MHPGCVMATEQLNPLDSHWYRMEATKSPTDILSVNLLEGPIHEARLRDVLERRLIIRRRFRSRVVDSLGGLQPPHWEDEPHFRIDDHFFRRKLEAPGDEAALSRLLHEIANDPLDFSHSPWRQYAIDGVLGGSALVNHVHHCMGDGFALNNILLSLTDPVEPPARPAAPPPAAPPRAPWPVEAMHRLRTVEEEALALAHLLVMPSDPVTSLRGKLSGRRSLAWTRAFALDRLRDDAHARGATVNDAVMSAISGALRAYFTDRGETPARIRGLVPVNLRPPSVPVDEEHGNYFGLIFVELPVDAPDRDARATALKREMDRIKSSKEAVVSLGIMSVLGRSPAAIDQVASELFARRGTVVITNVPGPRERLMIGGHAIKDMFFWVPHPNLACGFSVSSYAGALRVGVRTDTAIVPEPEKLAAYFTREMAGWTRA
jgi:diacylglycerol O-acyltransferase / wax synthase